ncbi:MAG TPA: hypothetical protein PK657_11220 [Legionella sp.]|nr:hypothetical protein [Legionella sp.]
MAIYYVVERYSNVRECIYKRLSDKDKAEKLAKSLKGKLYECYGDFLNDDWKANSILIKDYSNSDS